MPSAIKGNFYGFSDVLNAYCWKSSWTSPGLPHVLSGSPGTIVSVNWTDTKYSLGLLRQWLQTAVGTNDLPCTYAACKQILRWGGDRDPNHGARPFIDGKYRDGRLVSYLTACRNAADLVSATLPPPPGTFGLVNAMLIKVHALAATDGLPIYDSRVAAASAALVELYRLETTAIWKAVPDEIAFPATLPHRTVRGLHEEALPPGQLSYGPNKARTAQEWIGAAVRLGWILQAYLDRGGITGSAQPGAMHALEAALFMIGYDIACLRPNLPATSSAAAGRSSTRGGKLVRAA